MVRIIEVGPRDGLQNEKTPIPTEEKKAFAQRLANSGLAEIEVTSFVSQKWVPQLGDAEELWPTLPPGPLYSALVPNAKGLERALACGVQRIALFTAASETFTRKNINMTIAESLERFAEIVWQFRSQCAEGFVRGYVSTAFACPYEGDIPPRAVAQVVERLFEIGVDEVSLGDTIGVAVPKNLTALSRVLKRTTKDRIAWHFHDTRGTAIANVARAMELGYKVFDASAGGLGGCPFAPGAGGNLATEDLVYFLERSGVLTSVSLPKLAEASLPILSLLGKAPTAKAQLAVLAVRQ